MARDGTADTPDQTKDCSDDSLIERRSYLKMAGLAVSTVAASGFASDTASAAGSRTLNVSNGDSIGSHLEGVSDGETVTIPSGTYRFSGAAIRANDFTVRGDGDVTFVTEGTPALRMLGDDWTFGGVRFDQQGGDMRLFPDGADWTIQNCAWTGHLDSSEYYIYPQIDAGRTGTIDRCWFGDGVSRAESCIFTYNGTTGDLTVSRSYFYQTGVYGADTQNPPKQDGVVHFDSCYFENCYNASCRTGMYGKTGSVTNCTIRYTSRSETPSSSWGGDGTSNLSGGSKGFRGVWAFWDDVVVEDCEIDVPYGPGVLTSSRHGNPSVSVTGGNVAGSPRTIGDVSLDSSVGSNPDPSPPSGCVTSATEAVTGDASSGSGSGSGSGSSDDGDDSGSSAGQDPTVSTLTIEGTGTTANYQFSADGDVAPAGDSLEEWDSASSSSAEGYVTSEGSIDSYAIAGTVSEFSFLEGEANLYLDGVAVTPQEVVEASTLTVVGQGQPAQYRFSVDGTLKGNEKRLEEYDSVSKSGAEGYVTSEGSLDSFVVLGDLADFTFAEGDAAVYVDGNEIDPEFMDARSLKIEGTGETAEYEFSVTGTLQGAGDSIEQWDSVSESSATGFVTSEGSVDAYQFTGELSDFAFAEGDATVYVDGTEVDPTAPDGSILKVQATGERALYEFSVTGDVSARTDIEDDDVIDDGTVSGNVGMSAIDAYRFTGDLSEFTFTRGDAVVTVDGKELDVAAAPEERTLEIEGVGETAQYEFSVSGSLRGVDDSIEQWDSVSENSATGYVTSEGSVDAYRFTGDLSEVTFAEGTAKVFVDGEEQNPTTSASKTLRIRGTGTASKYAFSVSDSLQAHSDTIEEWDSVSTTSAAGYVTSEGSVDAYEFTGELSEFTFEQGDADVTVDGEAIDVEIVGPSEPITHTLTIEGRGEATEYEFAVDGSLDGTGDSIEQWDSVSESSATGYVTDSSNVDEFTYTGSVTQFEFLQGDATVYVDGTETAPDQLVA